jgi:hypothetical protein
MFWSLATNWLVFVKCASAATHTATHTAGGRRQQDGPVHCLKQRCLHGSPVWRAWAVHAVTALAEIILEQISQALVSSRRTWYKSEGSRGIPGRQDLGHLLGGQTCNSHPLGAFSSASSSPRAPAEEGRPLSSQILWPGMV